MFELIAFDADDTLWENEQMFVETQDRLRDLLAGYLNHPLTTEDLYERERRNLEYFGYGIKAFALSMIETAIELTQGTISGHNIHAIIQMAKQMLNRPINLLPYAANTVSSLALSHRLMLVTKGDLFEQETKIARSGLVSYFSYVEILSEKSQETYRKIFARLNVDPRDVLMVGNSLRSDIIPIVELGGTAVHIPYELTWVHETNVADPGGQGYYELEHIGLLPELVDRLEAR